MEGTTPTIRISIFEDGKVVREEVFTQKSIRIGKSGQAHLRLADPSVSRQHAVIDCLDSGEVRLTDLESTSGTTVRGEKVTQVALKPGDEIKLGDAKIVIDYVADASSVKAGSGFSSTVSVPAMMTGKFGVEVTQMWGDFTLAKGYFPSGRTVVAGDVGPVDFLIPEEKTGFGTFEFLKAEEKFFLLNVSGDKIDADFLVEDKIIRLPEMKRRGLVIDDKWVRIDQKTRARVKYDNFTFVVGLGSQPQGTMGSSWNRFSMREHMYLILSIVIHLAIMLLVTLVPEDQLIATRDPYDRETKALRKIQVAMLERKVEEDKKEKEEEDRKKFEEAKDNEAMVDRLSKIDPTDKVTSKIVVANPENDKNIANQALTQVMGQQDALLDRLLDSAGPGLGGGTMGIRVIGDRGIDADLANSLGAFGGMAGAGGGGFQGTGAWGGGGEFAPADLSGIAGLSKRDAEGSSGKIKFKGGGTPAVYAGTYSVKGELDKETVRRYIQTKMNQIRWCYQQEVQKNPDLAGQVKMQWVILPTGNTAGVKVAESSINSPEVERCVADRIMTWRFPSPKGGNAVQVWYPFIFRVTK